MDRFEAMSMLLMVVEKGSLSAAGRTLQVPVPTLSRKLSDLEALLGSRLLIRTTRKLTLTDAGIAYVAAARRILEQLDDAEREAAGEFTTPKGELVLTAPILFGRLHVLPVVADFLAGFPEINVRLVLLDRNVDLVDDHVDMAVRIGTLPDSAMVATRIGEMRTVVCGAPSLFARHGMPIAPRDIARFPIVSIDTFLSASAWQMREPDTKAVVEVPIRPRLRVSTAEAAAQAAAMGVGLTRLFHYQVADTVAAGALRIVLADYEIDPSPINLIHASRGQLPLKMRRFLDFAAPRLRERSTLA
ncbi:MAG: LysR family transcriptional regulator [Sphingomonas sp.]